MCAVSIHANNPVKEGTEIQIFECNSFFRLATELPDSELRKTLWSLVAFPKLKRQVAY